MLRRSSPRPNQLSEHGYFVPSTHGTNKITLRFPRRTYRYVGARIRELTVCLLVSRTFSSIGVQGDDQGWGHRTWDRRRTAVAGGMPDSAGPAAGRGSWRIGLGACQQHEVACRLRGLGRWRVCPRETRQWIHRRHRSSQRARVH